MAKYLIQANYVGEGIKGLLKEGGSSRRAAVEKLAESLGGTIEAYYYAFGDTDLFVIADMPDNVSCHGGLTDGQRGRDCHRQGYRASDR